MRIPLPFILVLLASGILLALVTGCGGGDDSEATPQPTATVPWDISPQVGGVEAARRYLQDTGIDGDKGNFTDPRSCAEVTKDTKGDYCVHENFSTYAPGLVILRIADKDKPLERVWEMRLTLQEKTWQVTEVKPFGESQ